MLLDDRLLTIIALELEKVGDGEVAFDTQAFGLLHPHHPVLADQGEFVVDLVEADADVGVEAGELSFDQDFVADGEFGQTPQAAVGEAVLQEFEAGFPACGQSPGGLRGAG
ncbi:MAG: hypothetical protein KIS61_24155 [Candidatus Eremiobacteraeota bacterium]|nr:hypothetical protein [Candidatus Eremiobacteraeota bacterium]